MKQKKDTSMETGDI